ncbi:hypothetical protein DID80_04655 [Candidatus Marinamargulisbacteria bacterium SCGC AAA071-K20]|nr:hypothetical protein DID80_04655 [Candidatus Marinamargulisbacteria bacterium SCGC AAA071-K20]
MLNLKIEKNDLVLYEKYGGTEIKLDKESYLIFSESDILAVKIT